MQVKTSCSAQLHNVVLFELSEEVNERNLGIWRKISRSSPTGRGGGKMNAYDGHSATDSQLTNPKTTCGKKIHASTNLRVREGAL